MNTADSIAITGLRAAAKGGADYLDDVAADLAEDVDKDVAQTTRLDAIARARAGAKMLREAAVEMRKLHHALEAMEDEAKPNG